MRVIPAIAIVLLALNSAVAQNDGDAPVVIVEAEEYAEISGLRVIERMEASGGLTVSYWEDPGTWLDLEFDLPVAGEYLISLRYALNWPDTRRVVLLDGAELGEVELATTGSWGDFETITLPFGPLQLPDGTVTLRVLNRDSRGLSLDWVAMHASDAPLADLPLGAEEQERLERLLVEAVGPQAQCILDFGEVQLHGTVPGGPAWANVSGHLLMTSGNVTDGRGEVTSHETEHNRIALLDGEAGLLVAITDGTNLHLLALLEEAEQIALPAPVMSAEGVRTVRARAGDEYLHLPAGEWQQEADHFEAGGMHITAVPGMIVRPWGTDRLAPGLLLETVEFGERAIGIARYATRWGPEQPRAGLEITGAGAIAREVARRYPTLATFYGEGIFDLRIAPDGGMTFVDLRSGETVTLRQGR